MVQTIVSVNSTFVSAPQRDPLTGFFDETALNLQLEQLISQRSSKPVAVRLALLQLGNFYEIRNWVGKAEANLLLSDIAQALGKALPSKVLAYRCPQYEFALLLTEECSLNATKITEQIKKELQAVASSTIPPQLELNCGVGLAALDDMCHSADVLLARARHNLCQYYYLDDFDSPNSFILSLDRETIIQSIQVGLQQDNFRLSYQPIVNLQNKDHEDYEVRCGAPAAFTSVPATALFEFAVLNALGEAIDRWVIRRCIRALQYNPSRNLRLTINLSQNSLVSCDFHPWLFEILRDHPDIQSQLIFQTSEIDILTSQHHIAHFCQRLEEVGIQLSINHFGCTPDPFRYLPLITATRVKLDVSLLERINESAHSRSLLKNTVGKLNEAGLRVVAGMIEDMVVVPILWRAKINYVQGNCFQPPTDTLNFQFFEDCNLSLH